MMRRCLLMLCAAALHACAGSDDDRPIPLSGYWGGDGASLALGEAGGWLDLDCAWGTIDAPLLLDDFGRFDLTGRYVQGPGPPPSGGVAVQAYRSARYEGWLRDERLTLRVTVEDEPTAGPFYLDRDELPSFGRLCY